MTHGHSELPLAGHHPSTHRPSAEGANCPAVTRHLHGLIATILAMVVVLGWSSAPVAAGGWAVGSLDSTPSPAPGESVEVGFTILQHGVTPAELDSDVGIELTHTDGTVEFFAAMSDDTPGHYVAAVTFPEAGSYAWSIRMGWFGVQDLGSISVDGSPSSSEASSAWPTVRWVMVGSTVALAAIAIADLARSRRRERVALA